MKIKHLLFIAFTFIAFSASAQTKKRRLLPLPRLLLLPRRLLQLIQQNFHARNW